LNHITNQMWLDGRFSMFLRLPSLDYICTIVICGDAHKMQQNPEMSHFMSI